MRRLGVRKAQHHLNGCFTEEAIYQAAPFDEPLEGVRGDRSVQGRRARRSRRIFTLTSKIVATEGGYCGGSSRGRLRISAAAHLSRWWIITLSSDGRCRHSEEWPFYPGQARAAVWLPTVVGSCPSQSRTAVRLLLPRTTGRERAAASRDVAARSGRRALGAEAGRSWPQGRQAGAQHAAVYATLRARSWASADVALAGG